MNKNEPSKQMLPAGFSEADKARIEKALGFVNQVDAHSDRPKGVDVAAILMKVHIDLESILAAILSDSRIAGKIPNSTLKENFGAKVTDLVKDVVGLNNLTVYSLEMTHEPNQSETLRRMLLAMTHDVRAVLIKLAYRIQRLHHLQSENFDVRKFIAQETLDIYAPLANRLGINQFKWELEDLAFRYLDPQNYRQIAQSLAENRKQRESSIENFLNVFRQRLQEENIVAKIYGRPKHIFSIWNKMRKKKLPIEELYDLLAVRVIVDNLTACYSVLGLAHSEWQYIPKEFDDYIAHPKENGYQSLHTVILDKQGNRIEIQIRTQAMHEFAELGVAAHWRYKEGNKHNAATEKNIATLRQLLEDKDTNDNLLERFKTELFSDRVFVLTPKGKLLDLIKGATPLDFAYAIHTEIGHSCRGAKINDRIKPLTYKLKSGDRVEILTVKNGKPNHNWIDPNLGYIKSQRAIGKVKNWLKSQQQTENIDAGKSILDGECKRLGLKTLDIAHLLSHFKKEDLNQLCETIGRGDINNRQLAAALHIPEFIAPAAKITPHKETAKSTITIAGINNVLTTMAHCCSPVQGDDIIGFISHKKGITVHRRDCENIFKLAPEKQSRLIPAEWGSGKPSRHLVPIIVHAFNAKNLLNDVTQILSHSKAHVSQASLKTHADLSAILNLTIQIENTEQLSLVLGRIGHLPDVTEVKRKV